MKVITLHELEERFYQILDEVGDEGQTYLIKTDRGNVVMMPANEYDTLTTIYEDWLNETGASDF